jgi:predicted aminopeptidase
VLVVLGLSVVVFFTLTPTGLFLLRAGWEEARILARRQPIERLIADPSTDAVTRAKLQLVVAARDFAVDSVGLDAGESFTRFTQLDRDTLLLVLSAAHRDTLLAHSWWFPIVGRVPYKGYFSFDRAREEEQRLRARGMDTYMRPASAFSTLGWFNDPLLSTTLAHDSAYLANTVIHELTHNTFYASGQAVFNESFANFVGSRGAIRFFLAMGDSAAAERAYADWENEKVLAHFWRRYHDMVVAAYAAHPGDREARLRARDEVEAEGRALLLSEYAPQLRLRSPAALARARLDNAALIARRIYQTDLSVFDQVLVREQGDLRAAVVRIIELARSNPADPFVALRDWVGLPAEPPAQEGAEIDRFPVPPPGTPVP